VQSTRHLNPLPSPILSTIGGCRFAPVKCPRSPKDTLGDPDRVVPPQHPAARCLICSGLAGTGAAVAPKPGRSYPVIPWIVRADNAKKRGSGSARLPQGLPPGGLTADCRDRDVPHRRIRLGAMPVALAGLDVHDVADI